MTIVVDRRKVPVSAWRTRLFVSTSEQQLRLPRDLIGGVGGVLVACGAWMTISTGIGSEVTTGIPAWIAWLVSLAAIAGTTGFISVAVLLCLAAGRRKLLVQATVASGTAALGCIGVVHGLEKGVGFAPPIVATSLAMAVLVVRTLAVPLRTPLWTLVIFGTVAEVFTAHLVPLGALGSAGLGTGLSALLAFALGTQDVAPTVDEAGGFLQQLGVSVNDLRRSPRAPTWGATRFMGTDDEGLSVDIDIYGRDAPEGQLLARVWRFVWVRRSTLDLRLRRVDHIEHTVGMMLWARSQGVDTPTVVVAGRVEPSDDAVLVTRPPPGRPLTEHSGDEVSDVELHQMWASLERLDAGGIALATVRSSSIVIGTDQQIGYLDFASAEAMAAPELRAADAASLLATTAEIVGPDRSIAAAAQAYGPERVAALLPLIQPQVLPTDPSLRTRKRTKQDLKVLRLTAARHLGIPPVEPEPLARIQLAKLLMLGGTFFGIWLLVEQLVGLQGIGHLIANANWWWVLAVLLITQATAATEAISMSGSMPGSPPIGPLSTLRLAMGFTGMIGGTVGTTATVIRFNQRRGLPPAVAISSGLIYSVTGFIIQIVLTLVALVFAADQFQRKSAGPSGSGPENLQLILYGIVAVSFIGGVVFIVPKVRSAVSDHLRPKVHLAWRNVRDIAQTPGRVLRLFGGAAATQLMMAAGLGFALRSVGASASFGGLVIVCTFTALLGGMAPVPGGMGVMEASYISGLTLLGVPQDQAIAATILYRLSTTYLPPIWGWGAMVWLRRHDAI